MKITLLNKSDKVGGAAIACIRLTNALRKEKIKARVLCQEKKTDLKYVSSLSTTKFAIFLDKLLFILERLRFLPYEREASIRYLFSLGNVGRKIVKSSAIIDSDIVHLHWINQGFLSLSEIQKLIAQKSIVWTLHDMWPFTGGCHHSEDCTNYYKNCGNCHYLKKPHAKDLSNVIWLRKQRTYGTKAKIAIVCCSDWLLQQARKSSLAENIALYAIPNPINIDVYKDIKPKKEFKGIIFNSSKKYILFGAASITNYYKGFKYLIEGLQYLKEKCTSEVELIIFGKASEEALNEIPIKYNYLGYIYKESDIIQLYNQTDITVLSSIRENLPNMIMESMACKTPVVAFNVGGIPEMIDHKENGYLAKYKSAEDLAKGMLWLLENDNFNSIQENARKKVINSYSEKVVAQKYIQVYNDLSAFN